MFTAPSSRRVELGATVAAPIEVGDLPEDDRRVIPSRAACARATACAASCWHVA